MSKKPERRHSRSLRTSSSNEDKENGSITVIDNRTGSKITVPIEDGTVNAKAFAQLRLNDKDGVGLRVFDHGYVNTSVVRSKICMINGDAGVLRYRGYAIEDLAKHSTFLEVAFLLMYGELPCATELSSWTSRVMQHTFCHQNMYQMMASFRHDAHPMGMLISSVAALSTFYPDANPAMQGAALYRQEQARNQQLWRLLGQLPTMAACSYRHRIGRPYNYPRPDLGYIENFLYMLDRLSEQDYRPHPLLVKTLDVLFILHAEHELSCSTATMRHVGSSLVDPYTAVASAGAALYGPLHGGANEAVLRMLERIGSAAGIPDFLEKVKSKQELLMGFGHRVYRNYDPRAIILRDLCHQVFDLMGHDPLYEVALELEKIARSDPYFTKRKLYPNVDFYSGLIYRAMGFPTDMFPVLFLLPRAAGWLAHWNEAMQESPRIWRPRQVYTGPSRRSYVPLEKRRKVSNSDAHMSMTVPPESKRSLAGKVIV